MLYNYYVVYNALLFYLLLLILFKETSKRNFAYVSRKPIQLYRLHELTHSTDSSDHETGELHDSLPKKKKTVAFKSTLGLTEMNFPGQSTNCSKNTIVTENTMALFNENKYQVRDAAVLFRLQPQSPQVARMQQEAI